MDVDICTNDESSLAPIVDETVDEYFKRVMGNIKLCQKYCVGLQDWHHFADYSGVRMTMTKINSILHGLMGKVFSHQDIKLDLNGFRLQDQFDIVREGNDALFEKINSDLDDASGIRRNIDIEIVDSTVRTIRGPVNPQTGRDMVLLASRNVQKPQVFFTTKVNNSSSEPFIPFIKEKPNSLKPLSILICLDEEGKEYYSHPYEYELQHWTPSESALKKKEPMKPKCLTKTPLLLVENLENLQLMVEELKESTEIAVDLEHHSFRSYLGLTCLIQISTRVKDYIVDPFPVRDNLLLLNEVFTNPKITKVFHGADQDILWLQRDCGVYVVNMFDTHQAAVILEYPHRSLAALLNKFCSIIANKTYQRADWRIRPIPEDFIEYARQDSHYLLYIFDVLRNELIEKGNELDNLIHSTYNRSMELCMKRYEKPMIGPDSHMDLYRKSRKNFNNRQMYAFQQLYLWRDRIARQQDESVDYVLPKHMMLQIAEILPKEMQGILACCNPIPTLVKTEQLTLHQIIRSAREQPLAQIESLSKLEQNSQSEALPGTCDVALTLVCKHDLSQVEDSSSGLSTLLNPQETLLGDLFNPSVVKVELKKKSGLYGELKDSVTQTKHYMERKTSEFMSPYERFRTYLTLQPLIEEEQKNLNSVPEPVTVNETKETISLLSDSGNLSFSSSKTRDKERLFRLQDHIANLAAEMSETALKKKKKKNQKLSLKEKIKIESKKQYKNEKQNSLSSEPALKRKSTETDIENLLKKIRTEGDVPAGVTEEGASKMETVEVPLNNSIEEVNEIEEKEEEENGEEEVKPFDYTSANFNIFKKKNKSKGKFKQNITQKFRGKGSNKPTGIKKSGLKSFTWGSKKN